MRVHLLVYFGTVLKESLSSNLYFVEDIRKRGNLTGENRKLGGKEEDDSQENVRENK